MTRSGGLTAPRENEVFQGREPGVEGVEFALEARNVRVLNDAQSRNAELSTEIEQVVLHLGQGRSHGAWQTGGGEREANGAVGLIDRAIGLHPERVLRDALPVAEPGGPVVPRARVDLAESIAHGVSLTIRDGRRKMRTSTIAWPARSRKSPHWRRGGLDNVNSTALVLLIAALLAFSFIGYRSAAVRADRARRLAALRKGPAVQADFTTPEGAILMLEEAFRRRDLEAAVAARDFVVEAELEAGAQQPTGTSAAIVARAAELEQGFRALMTASWPDFSGVESYFVDRQPYRPPSGQSNALGFAVITEVNRFAGGGYSEQRILVTETVRGWRVLKPLE